MVEFIITYETWVADGKFFMVGDKTDFRYEVGEAELEVEMRGGQPTEADKKKRIDRMDEQVSASFMKQYS